MTEASGTSSSPEDARAPLEVIDLGRRAYVEAYDLQEERLAARIRGEVPDGLLLVEHDPVVTRGRRSREGDTAGVPFPVVDIGRGGEATYHGPGQLVAYSIIELPEARRDLHRYLRDLEQVVIDALRSLGIEGRREPGKTGVWIGARKVCSIGVAVRRWVTWHGLALNVTTDLDAFRSFAPCGLDASVMTRVADHIEPGEPLVLLERARDAVEVAFRAYWRSIAEDGRG
ncbi:MAG: lipoyl(octanoyl) transferase LipB [Planctomycetota bacterium]|nr:lipoyl(octanoyl) transferase LipB [Planctomycetota bacterium]